MIGSRGSIHADNGPEYEARIANMISEGGMGVTKYYNYEEMRTQYRLEEPQQTNPTNKDE